MSIYFQCEACSRKITVADEHAGKRGKCPGCGSVVNIPAGVTSSPDPVAPKQELLPAVVKHEAFAASLPAPPPLPPAQTRQEKACLFCGESILATAIKCKHCGEVLDPVLLAAQQPAMTRQATPPVPQVHVVHQPAQPIVVQQTTVATTHVGYYRRPFNHLLHFVLTLITCGAWLPIWITMWIVYILA